MSEIAYETSKISGPAFERAVEYRIGLISDALTNIGVSIPEEATVQYLSEIDPEILDYPFGKFSDFTQSITNVGIKLWYKLFYKRGPDGDSVDHEHISEIRDEDTYSANGISTFRTICLLAHLSGMPLSEIRSKTESELYNRAIFFAGQHDGFDLPVTWNAGADRKKVTKLFKAGHDAGSRSNGIEILEGSAQGVDDITQELPSINDAYAIELQRDVAEYVVANPDPKVLATKMLNTDLLRLLGQIGTKKPLS